MRELRKERRGGNANKPIEIGNDVNTKKIRK